MPLAAGLLNRSSMPCGSLSSTVPDMGAEPGPGPRWLSVAEAARALGVTERAIRRRVQRNTLEMTREVVGNRSRLLVRVDVQDHRAAAGTDRGPDPVPDRSAAKLIELTATLARLEERVAQQDRFIAHLEAELARRRWPGLWPALRRLWWGEG